MGMTANNARCPPHWWFDSRKQSPFLWLDMSFAISCVQITHLFPHRLTYHYDLWMKGTTILPYSDKFGIFKGLQEAQGDIELAFLYSDEGGQGFKAISGLPRINHPNIEGLSSAEGCSAMLLAQVNLPAESESEQLDRFRGSLTDVDAAIMRSTVLPSPISSIGM